jgi:hypothetical protein
VHIIPILTRLSRAAPGPSGPGRSPSATRRSGWFADSLTRAADTLTGLLDAPEPHIRIRAARSLFSMGMRLRDSVDLTARMRAIEAELASKQGGTP